MKNTRVIPALAAVFVLSFTACQKNTDKIDQEGCFPVEEESNLADEFDADLLEEFEYMEVYGDLETDMDLENEGIPEILDEFTFEDESQTTGKARIRCNNLNLDKKDLLRLRNAWDSYLKCRIHTMTALRTLHRNSLRVAVAQRDKAVKLLRNGDITREQFQDRMESIRSNLRKNIREQGLKLRQAIIACHRNYTNTVKTIIGADNHENWLRCLRSKLRYQRR